MYTAGLALKLKPDAYAEYKRRHDALWPEMSAMMSDFRISMVIYRFGEWLFVHGMAPTREQWQCFENAPINPKWDEYMKDVLETDENDDLICHKLPLAFSFGDYE